MSEASPKLRLDTHLPKKDFFKSLISQVSLLGFDIDEVDDEKPWGGYIRVASNQAEKFIEMYFSGIKLPKQIKGQDLSPKFLIMEPNKRFSYQYHERRYEFWRVLAGPAGIKLHHSDMEPDDFEIYQDGNTINIPPGIRHRLIGLDNLNIITELWIHNDSNNLSDEADIIRINDDFGRNNL